MNKGEINKSLLNNKSKDQCCLTTARYLLLITIMIFGSVLVLHGLTTTKRSVLNTMETNVGDGQKSKFFKNIIIT